MNGESIAIAAAIVAVVFLFVHLGIALYRKFRSTGEPHGRALETAIRKVMLFFVWHGGSLLIGGGACWLAARFLDAPQQHELDVLARILLLGGVAFVVVALLVIYCARRLVRLSSD